jgi:hypothetical protein
MNAALATEAVKLRHATVARATTLIMALGISLICSTMLLAAGTDDPSSQPNSAPSSIPEAGPGTSPPPPRSPARPVCSPTAYC